MKSDKIIQSTTIYLFTNKKHNTEKPYSDSTIFSKQRTCSKLFQSYLLSLFLQLLEKNPSVEVSKWIIESRKVYKTFSLFWLL